MTQYFQHYHDFISTRAFLEGNRHTLDAPSELDKFLSRLAHHEKIFLISREERLSNDPNIKRKFTQGAIVNTINQYLSELHLPNGSKYSSHSKYDDSDSNSDSNVPSRPPASRFSGFRGFSRTTSLTWLSSSSSKKKKKKKKKKKPPTRRVNQIQVDIHDPLASLVIPDGLEQQEIMRVHMYQVGLRKVTKDVTKFTDGMKCIICHQPHTFEMCPILNDIPYIKKHFISYCFQMNKTQRQILTAIHRIDATWGTATNNNNDDDDDDDSHVNTDNDADFQEEEE